MADANEIEAALLDCDGSARDVNFDAATWDGVRNFINHLRSEYSGLAVGATSADTDDAQVVDVGKALENLKRGSGYAQFLLSGGTGLVRHLQVFVSTVDGTTPDVELTFVPPDVNEGSNLAASFIEWAKGACSIVGGGVVYARYENASWDWGDLGPHSGVFYHSKIAAQQAVEADGRTSL